MKGNNCWNSMPRVASDAHNNKKWNAHLKALRRVDCKKWELRMLVPRLCAIMSFGSKFVMIITTVKLRLFRWPGRPYCPIPYKWHRPLLFTALVLYFLTPPSKSQNTTLIAAESGPGLKGLLSWFISLVKNWSCAGEVRMLRIGEALKSHNEKAENGACLPHLSHLRVL